MRVWRFSRAILVMGLVLLMVVSATLLTTAYLGSGKALRREAENAQARDQRGLDSLMEAHFRSIRNRSREAAQYPPLRRALRRGDEAAVTRILTALLQDGRSSRIDALVVERGDTLLVAKNPGLLDQELPWETLGRRWAPQSTWTSLTVDDDQGRPHSLMRLTLPIVAEELGEVVGRLQAFVLLNDSFWILNELQQLFGAQAILLSHEGDTLDALENTPGQLEALQALDTEDRRVLTTWEGILREHRLQIGQSHPFRVYSLLPNEAYLALKDAYIVNLVYAPLLVAFFGVLWMLAIRSMTRRALGQVVRYAEQVPRSGAPTPFVGGRFREFNRVGKAVEAMLMRTRERDRYLSGIIENAPDLVFVKDLEGRYRLVNERYAWVMRSTPDDLLLRRAEEALDEDNAMLAKTSERQLLEKRSPVQYEQRLQTPEGLKRYLVTKFPILDDQGRPYLIGGIATDITGRTQAEQQLQLAHQVFAETSEAIVVLDEQRRVVLTNRAFDGMSGLDGARASAVVRDFLLSHPEVARHLECGQPWQGQCDFRQGGAEPLPVLVSATTLPLTEGVRRHVLLFRDISALKVAEQRLERLAWYDPLTGLANRSLYTFELDEVLVGEGAAMAVVVFVDLDHFKDINDTHGHSVGDELLCQVADRLRSCVQPRDTVARFGGDEFSILLRDIADDEQAMSVARRILRALSEPYELGVVSVFSAASLGVALSARHGRSTEVLMRNADQAMYEAKSLGRHQVVLFEPAIDERHQLRLRYEAGLHRAIDNDEFTLLFQPRFDIAGARVVGAEALLRWHSEEHGQVSPSVFIPIAEASGLIVEIGRFVLQRACHQAASWVAAGHEVPVSVNLSPRQLREGELVQDIAAALRSAGLPPTLLELEITETHLMDNVDQVLPVLNQLRAMGVKLAIDDFGTGYSSLTYLKRLPTEILKIDRSFLLDVPGDSDDETLLAAIISMSHSLDFRVVAEGVETEAQRRFLEKLGCDELQGFLLGRPQSLDHLLALLDRTRECADHRG